MNVLNVWFERLYNLSENHSISFPNAFINKQGYCRINIGRITVLNFLKTKIQEMNLPVLERKWCKIKIKPLVHINKKIRDDKIMLLIRENKKTMEIAKILNIAPCFVSNVRTKINNPEGAKNIDGIMKNYLNFKRSK